MTSDLPPRSGRTEGLTPPTTLAVEPVTVEAVEGPGRGARASLERGTLSVGSASGCDLVLADRAVSSRHATVELLAGAVRVRDLGSKNGTSYLGARIVEARVPIGGSVRLGRTTLRIAPSQRSAPLSEREELCGLVGHSVAMRRLFAQVERLAPGDMTLLLLGETGSGKGAVARALHALSPRASSPFVVFDCGAVAGSVIESELFGHVQGAFTGAARSRAGAVETAADGTLLLDEVGELPIELQPKLLRLLESGEFRRLGDNADRRCRARIVAATNRDLTALVSAGAFRSDLYFRLEVAVLRVPPLRDRLEDIPLLVQLFAREQAGIDVDLAPATMAELQCDPWPGNVRELRNAVERALTLGDLGEASSPATTTESSFKDARDRLLARFERDYVASLLQGSKGNVSAAARKARLSRSQFYRLLTRHGLG